MLRAKDIWQVIRYELYLSDNHGKKTFTTAAKPPLRMTDEELPKMKPI